MEPRENLTQLQKDATSPNRFSGLELIVVLLNSHCRTILQGPFCDILCCNEVHRFEVDDFLVATSWECPSDPTPRGGNEGGKLP